MLERPMCYTGVSQTVGHSQKFAGLSKGLRDSVKSDVSVSF